MIQFSRICNVWLLSVFLVCSTVATAAPSLEEAKADLEANRSEVARDKLHEIVLQQPDNHQAWFLYGVATARQQQYHQAIEAFRRVIELSPELAEPHNNLAVIYNELGDVRAAIGELEQSLKKRPGYVIAEENLGDLYIKLAIEYYRSAMEKGENPALEKRYTRLLQVRDPGSDQAVKAAENSPPSDDAANGGDNQPVKEEVRAVRPVAADQQVMQAVEAWRQAWSRRDLGGYFAAYADDFKVPTKYSTLQKWRQYKHRVIGSKDYIQVDIDDIQIEVSPDNRYARVKFFQKFRSNSYNGDDLKVLEMKLDQGRWKIVSEVSVQ